MDIFYVLLIVLAAIVTVLTFLWWREKEINSVYPAFLEFKNKNLQRWVRVAFLCCCILLVVTACFAPESLVGSMRWIVGFFFTLICLLLFVFLFGVALYFLFSIGLFIWWFLIMCWAWVWQGDSNHYNDND